MKSLLRLSALACLLISSAAFAQTDILQVVPEKALAAAIAQNADAAELHFREMAGRLSGDLPKESFIEQMLQLLKVRPAPAGDAEPAAPKDSVIDVKAPMAVVLVLPALDVQGMPLGLVVKVADYKKLLDELVKVSGAAAPEVTPDGTDLVKGQAGSLFVAPFGQFAVIADAEYVIRTFKAEAKRSLAESALSSVREGLAQNDIVLYGNLDDVMKTYGAEIGAFKKQMVEGVRGMPAQQGPMTPEKMAKILGAEIDLFVNTAQQIDALCYGFKFSVDGARMTTHVEAVADSELAKMSAMLKPAPLDALNLFDSPAFSAVAWNLDPELIKAVSDKAMVFFKDSGLIEPKEGEKNFLDVYAKILAAAGGQGGVAAFPSPAGEKGVLRLAYVLSLKPNVDVREDLRDYLQESMKMMNAFGMPFLAKSKVEAGVETYRGSEIDRVTITFEPNPDAPEGGQGPEMLKMIETIYGPELVSYVAQVKDKLVYTVGYASADVVKAQMDRVLDGKAGTLTASPAWKSATEGMPPAQPAVFYLSLAEVMKSVVGRLEMLGPDAVKAVRELVFEKPSGAVMTVGPATNGIKMMVLVPMQEMENIKTLVLAMEPKPAAAEAAPVVPPPAPDHGAPPGP